MTTAQQLRRPIDRCQRGFSLVEVLVSVFVLSLGVLGAVGMQAASLQAGKEVRNQAMAGSMAKELAERMRGNHAIARQAANPYLMSTVLTGSATTALERLTTVKNCATATTPCSPTDLAAFDIWEWQIRAGRALPTPRIEICLDSAPFDSNGVPQWNCTPSGIPGEDVAVLKLSWTRTNTKGELEFTSGSGTTTLPLLVLPLTAGSSQ